MSYAKLKGKITEVFGTQAAFAVALGVDSSTLSSKLTNKTDWKREEIEKTCDLLSIPLAELHEYFFTPKVAKTQLNTSTM